MRVIGDILRWILLVYLIIVFLRIIIDWLRVKWPRPLRRAVVFIFDITEPVLSPLRRLIPSIPVGSGAALDLSPTVLIVVVWFLYWLVGEVFY